MRSLMELYRSHLGKVSDKWCSNIRVYDEIMGSLRDRELRILEIGIQNGGSLEIWAKYFPAATRLIGCDINEVCRELVFDDPRISVVVGDANDPDVLARIRTLCGGFDIIIDAGSHRSGDIVRTFAAFFPLLTEGGLYIVEDLHCSYWQEFEGGIEDPGSSLGFFRRLTDFVNREHWGSDIPPDQILSYYSARWGAQFAVQDLERIAQVTFRNSLVTVFKQAPNQLALGQRLIAGADAQVCTEILGLNGTMSVPLPQGANARGPLSMRHEAVYEEACTLRSQVAEATSALADLRRENEELTHEIAVVTPKLKWLESELVRARTRPLEATWQLVQYHILSRLAKAKPVFSRRRLSKFSKSAAKRDPLRHLKSLQQQYADSLSYAQVLREWSQQRRSQATVHKQLVDSLRDGPLISVVVPVYNPDPKLLSEMIDSVIEQSYPNWELCIADDCSTNPQIKEVLDRYATDDTRIRIVYRNKNGHISRATNSAIELARGAFVALLAHDDLLDPDALLWVARNIREKPSTRIIYTDEDKVREDGTRYDPHFKPDWNRELVYGTNYVSHLGVYETELLREVGGLRPGFEGAQDYDLLLRCIEHVNDSEIMHIPKVLYSWRTTAGSTAASNQAKPYASEAGRSALAEHLSRTQHYPVAVESGPFPFTYRVLWPLAKEPKVSIIIPTRDQIDLLRMAVGSILARTDYENFEIVIVDNGSVEPETLEWLTKIQASESRVKVFRDERPFNYSALNNAAVRKCSGEIIALVNNDIEVIDKGWLREMVSLAVRPDIGCVGAKLHFPDGRIQHGGVIIGHGGVAAHSHLLFPEDSPGYFGRLSLRQEYSAVTAACLVVRRTIFGAVGGLNEADLSVAFNDVDFCLKVQEAGYRNIWTPWARMYHHESASRGYEDTPEKKARFRRESAYMKTRWHTVDFADPAYNPNLTLDRHDFSFATPRWFD